MNFAEKFKYPNLISKNFWDVHYETPCMYILFSVIKHKKVTIIIQIKCLEENICYVFFLDLTEFQVSKSLGLAEEQIF